MLVPNLYHESVYLMIKASSYHYVLLRSIEAGDLLDSVKPKREVL